jgi:hypothetical protein
MRVVEWARKRIEYMKEWRALVREIGNDTESYMRLSRIAGRMGYDRLAVLQSAIKIAERCEKAEEAFGMISRAVEMEDVALVSALPDLVKTERLAMLIERCGELSGAAGKVLRHGYDGQSPYNGLTNRVTLERKLGGLLAMIEMLEDSGDVKRNSVRASRSWVQRHVGEWTHHRNAGEVA